MAVTMAIIRINIIYNYLKYMQSILIRKGFKDKLKLNILHFRINCYYWAIPIITITGKMANFLIMAPVWAIKMVFLVRIISLLGKQRPRDRKNKNNDNDKEGNLTCWINKIMSVEGLFGWKFFLVLALVR